MGDTLGPADKKFALFSPAQVSFYHFTMSA